MKRTEEIEEGVGGSKEADAISSSKEDNGDRTKNQTQILK